MLFFGRQLWGRALSVDGTTQVGGTAASQSVKLPQLVPQEVPQRGAANRAAEARQQEVSAGAGSRREGEVVRVIPLCLHDRGEPRFLLKQ